MANAQLKEVSLQSADTELLRYCFQWPHSMHMLMLVLQELSYDIYHKVHIFVPMTTRARLVCADRPISFHSGPKDQVNQSKNSSSSGQHNPTREAEELREEKDPTENI